MTVQNQRNLKVNTVTVVIRAAGERTEQVCYDILVDQVDASNIHIIREKPFVNAVKRNFEIGIESKKKWTLSIDADVLVNSNCVTQMIAKASSLDKNLFVYQGQILDKLFNAYRSGGPHLYQTCHLPKALNLLNQQTNPLRPESATYQQMAEIGLWGYFDNKVYGIHDFGQYNKDIFRKAFFHGIKHTAYVSNFLPNWIKQMEKDIDYKIALIGLSVGLSYRGEVKVDVDFFEEVSSQYMPLLDISEKREFVESDINSDELISTFDLRYPLARKGLMHKNNKIKAPKSKDPLSNRLPRKMRNFIGYYLEQFGKKIQKTKR